MPRVSHIQYNPNLTVKQNAKDNGVSDAAIRNYIKENHIDRRFLKKQAIIEDCREYLKKHPKASWNEIHEKKGYSLSTLRNYREFITTDKPIILFDKNKAEKRQEDKAKEKDKQFDILDTIPEDVIHEYLSIREQRLQGIKENDCPTKVEDVIVLDEYPLNIVNEFRIPIDECIQFHSKALPENKVLSNHFDCIITFRGVEFFALEQMYMALTYSDSPKIIKKIMSCNSGTKAKSLCHDKYHDERDWDYEIKQYRIIALCHLYKYLSVKEYRDRLRETYPQTLVECPNGKDYEYGMVQNLETNVFEGKNISGRTTMLVRDMMKELEDNAIQQEEDSLGRNLTEEERENLFNTIYESVRNRYDNSKQVIKDSKPLFTVIEKYGIPKKKRRKPTPFFPPIIDRTSKCLIMDFDDTLFDTTADDIYRKGEKVDINKAMEMIPEYKLYDGWEDVFEWVKQHHVKVGILSGASGKLIAEAMNHFNIHFDAIVGYQPYIGKPNPILGNMIMEKLNVRENQIIYVGNAADDDIQARSNMMKFYGTTWGKHDSDFFREKGIRTISNPREIIPLLEQLSF